MRKLLLTLLALFISGTVAGDDKVQEIAALRMDKATLTQWKQHEFEGLTLYKRISVDNRVAIKAVSHGTASAFYREMEVDIRQYPYLSWSWKVTEAAANPVEKQKSGDDFAARIYVVVKTGLFPWQVIAFNYVWSMDNEPSREWASPYSEKVIMKVMNRGQTEFGQWHTHKVNILKDLQATFGQEIQSIDGIAVMTDMDDTGNSATAYYGNITFSKEN